MPPDFSRLYRELGLQPDCSLDAFRCAYRRLVSRQHPDRPAALVDCDGALALADLISLHEQAMQFHRHHGRLPGASVPLAYALIAAETVPASAPSSLDRSTYSPIDKRSPTRTLHRLVWLAVGVLVLIAIGLSQPRSPVRAARSGSEHPLPTSADAVAPALQLAIGMDTSTARSIQGEPLRISDNTWEYGPSWLKFKRGALVDWYSSPLRPLKVPTPDARDAEPLSASRDAL